MAPCGDGDTILVDSVFSQQHLIHIQALYRSARCLDGAVCLDPGVDGTELIRPIFHKSLDQTILSIYNSTNTIRIMP